ncbi:MAG: aldo/keto reductase [Clostridiales bacterium]|nr:aldo/keto reductase [Clostridiales bacterium]
MTAIRAGYRMIDTAEAYGNEEAVGNAIIKIGVSNFDPDRLIDLIEFNQVPPAVDQIETHLLCQRRAERAWLEKYHVQHMAYAPLGQGRKNEMFENPALLEIAEAHGKTPAQIALRFLIQSGVIVIPKSVHECRIQENFNVFDFELTEKEMDCIRRMDTGISMIGNPENPLKTEAAMKW